MNAMHASHNLFCDASSACIECHASVMLMGMAAVKPPAEGSSKVMNSHHVKPMSLHTHQGATDRS